MSVLAIDKILCQCVISSVGLRQKVHCLKLFCLSPSLLLYFRYKNVERLAAEEYERERVLVAKARPDLDLHFDPPDAWPSLSRSSTPSSFASQEDTEADLESETPTPSYTPSETGRTTKNTLTVTARRIG